MVDELPIFQWLPGAFFTIKPSAALECSDGKACRSFLQSDSYGWNLRMFAITNN